MAQWFITAERPPYLSCIAPWEGASDFYRETLCQGGEVSPTRRSGGFSLVDYLVSGPYLYFRNRAAMIEYSLPETGRNKQEDVLKMLEQYPYMNEYWADKRARISQINVPAYVLASFSSGLHTTGSFLSDSDVSHVLLCLQE
jgi:predicted acyl esterase